MKKIIILIPVFNDWQSLNKLITEIEENISDIKNFSFACLIVNDASTIDQFNLKKPKSFSSLKILNMKINKGHARCNAFGIRYVSENENFDYLIIMDGDGEDRPAEIKSFIDVIEKDKDKSIVAKRVKRSEGFFFKFLYFMHKFITLVFTGKKINFGNYTCLTNNDARKISSEASLWSSFSGTFKKKIENFNEIDSLRGVRYFGPSKMSLFKLIIHSFAIIAVFKFKVFFRIFLFMAILIYLKSFFGIFSVLSQILILSFGLAIFLVSLRENKSELLKCHENLENEEDITH